ncbi:spore maturation protein B [Alteribacillus persepolensis]|uniref:Spore maturation protein B n=1 Tax=Alteribacillus persepolensis TaxID=568899 RepID=A0A1G7ZNF4_9BACI|nr:spore maturation protein [Alteribacillus persepolensis]SDH09630.1 spore maturation protein B [Alteribacillus persepolensis]
MSWMSTVSLWILPVLLLIILLHASVKRVPAYDSFVEGGKDGFQLAVSLIPYLVGMMVAISVFRASGAMELLLEALKPFLILIGVPADIVPLAVIRPISGAGALGMTTDLIREHGPDSFIGRLASTMQGSTDTTLYVLTVYFGAAGIKYMGDALKVGLLADAAGIAASIVIVTIVFGM